MQNDRWIFVRDRPAIERLVTNAFTSGILPRYFQARLQLAGMVFSPGSKAESSKAGIAALARREDSLGAVEILLSDPAALFERQRLRTASFAVLIAVSTISLVAGYAASYRALRKEQRLGAMRSSFVSSVSHELRAPIASVHLMAEELIDLGGNQAGKAQEYHLCILHECRRLSALIENVLDFARHEQGRKEYQFEPTDMRKLMTETLCLMKPYANERSVRLALDAAAAGGAAGVRGEEAKAFEPEIDGRAVQQVLINLIDNAIKHSPAGELVSVGLELQSDGSATEMKKAVQSEEWRREGRFAFWVEDHGPGIPAEEHQRIFEQFYRRGSELRRETQGVGLGLAIVRFIVQAHRGQIHLQSEVGKGTRFRIELPIHPMPAN